MGDRDREAGNRKGQGRDRRRGVRLDVLVLSPVGKGDRG